MALFAGMKCPMLCSAKKTVAVERMPVVYSVVRQVGERFVHCIEGVSREVCPHALMPVIVVVRLTAGGAG